MCGQESILRLMASLGVIEEVAAGVYTANQTTENLVSKEACVTTSYLYVSPLTLSDRVDD